MTDSEKPTVQKMLEGSNRSLGVKILLGAAACAEPFYSGMMRLRNAMYDRGMMKSRSLGRPTISVGNLTVGGTGKTPVVRWLADKLLNAGEKPGILLRGYKPTPQGFSDEAELLRGLLEDRVPVVANPDRIDGASSALTANPETSVFILDDAMQHRRAARDFELVLIHAAQPFGFDHVLPRGLLREPIRGLKRADAILITHANEIDLTELNRLEGKIRQYNSHVMIYRADHAIDALRGENDERFPVQLLADRKYISFCGIGSPESFLSAVKQMPGNNVHFAIFEDHHAYTADELSKIENAARERGAEMMITTEKDWVKVKRLKREEPSRLPIYRTELSLRFWEDHEKQLMERIDRSIKKASKNRVITSSS